MDKNEVIWKQQIDPTDFQTLLIPQGAEILSCQVQNEIPQLWFKCNPDNEKEARIIRIFGTGHRELNPNETLEFIDTIQLMGGSLVFHVFELTKVRN